jgi:hypothetical protein
MDTSERNALKKLQTALLLAASDLFQAAAAAHALDEGPDELPLMLALETAIAVCYARAFTTSSLLRLDDEYAPAAPSDAELCEPAWVAEAATDHRQGSDLELMLAVISRGRGHRVIPCARSFPTQGRG